MDDHRQTMCPSTEGQLHTWTDSCHDSMHKTCREPTRRRGGGHGVPTLPEELLANGDCWTGRASSTHKHPLETLLTARLHVHHLETQRRKWTNT
ncbi:hypothetical protein ACRRTK_011996 [Alexandromys fortis]